MSSGSTPWSRTRTAPPEPEPAGLARPPWLIDHGAALYVHHTWRDPDAHAVRPFERIATHVLLPYAGSIAAAIAGTLPGSTARC